MTKLAGDHAQVLVDGYELTGDHNSITIDDARDTCDVTAFSDEVHHFICRRRQIRLSHAGYLNADAGRTHPVLKGLAVNGIVSLLLGQNTDPAVGDPMYSLSTRQGEYQSLVEMGKYVPFTAAFANQGELGGWGSALAVPVEFTNSTNGSSVDGGAASADGGAAYLHVLTVAASDTYTLTVEGSATGAFAGEESTLATFTLDASALGSEWQAIVGSIPQHTRWKAVRSGSAGDTVKVSVNLVRF